MSINYFNFDKEEENIMQELSLGRPILIRERELLRYFEYLLQKIEQEEGLSLEYETKVTIKKAEIIESIPINISKKLFIKTLHEKSDEISNYIKDVFKLDEEKVININGFLSEYTNKNESSLDTIKSVREKNE